MQVRQLRQPKLNLIQQAPSPNLAGYVSPLLTIRGQGRPTLTSELANLLANLHGWQTGIGKLALAKRS